MQAGGEFSPESAIIEEVPLGAGRLRAAGAQGVKWSMAQTVGGIGVRLMFTFVLVRLVGPANFGVIAQATLYTGLVSVVLDQGFGVALVQRKVLDRLDIGTVTWMNIVSGLVLGGLTFVLAPVVADFFHTDQLAAVLRVLSVGPVIESLGLVPKALLRRGLRFRALARIEIAAVTGGGRPSRTARSNATHSAT